MRRILVRAHKHPLRVASVQETRERNLLGDNAGNLVFSQSVIKLLSTRDARIGTARLHRNDAGQINENFDHVAIPLANAFRYTFSDFLDAMSDIIERLTIPVSIVGVGAQATLGGTYRHADQVSDSVRRFVGAVLDRSPSIGVRGERTAAYLAELGFGDEHVDVIGCPSLFMYGPHLRVEKKVETLGPDSPIALNISPYVHTMGPLSMRHAERYPNLRYMAQDLPSLELMETGVYDSDRGPAAAKAGVPVSLAHPLVREDRIRFFVDPRTWFDHLAGYDFSFGTRIHGNIAALLAGTPALVLAHDSRTLELAEFHEIPRRAINEIGKQADAAELYAEADWGPMNDGHQARWENFAGFLAKHSLPHVFADGEDPTAFEAQLDALEFPPPVRTLMGADPADLYAMKNELELLQQSPRASLRAGVQRIPSSVRRRLGVGRQSAVQQWASELRGDAGA